MSPCTLPGQKAAASRDTDGTFAVSIGESSPAAGEFVECRRLDHRMSGRAEQMSRPVVGRDQQDVGAVAGSGQVGLLILVRDGANFRNI